MPTDNNKTRSLALRYVETPFQHNWQFRIAIDGIFNDLDMYVADISYTPWELETKEINIGGQRLTFPRNAAPVEITMTVRDNQREEVYSEFDNWFSNIYNGDGTFNAPYDPVNGYIKKWTRFQVITPEPVFLKGTPSVEVLNGLDDPFNLIKAFESRLPKGLGTVLTKSLRDDQYKYGITTDGFTEVATRSWDVFPTRLGEITESYSELGSFLSFPITLMQFRS